MNLWLRLLWLVISAWQRPALKNADDLSVLHFYVMPSDLDISLHMNNSRYLALMDLGRLDFMARVGLWPVVRRHRWTPIVSAIVIRYRRELRPLASFRLETRLVAWAEASVIMEQTFVHNGGRHAGQVAARALFKGGVYSRAERRFVDIPRMMAEIGVTAQSPPWTPEIEAFLKADSALKVTAAGYASQADDEPAPTVNS
jgi:acyl-CoA thioesterase FadM